MEYKDYYKILEVDKSATKDEIKRSFRKLAKKYHPDMNRGDAASQDKFKDINEAYEVLGDDEKRKKYDMIGAQGYRGGQPFDPSDFGYGTYTYTGSDAGGFSDFFNSIFGGGGFGGFGNAREGGAAGSSVFSGFGRGAKRQPPRQQYTTEISLSLQDAFNGTQKNLLLNINGKNVDVPVKVPKGILPGKKIKMRGEPYGLDGDIYVKINIIDTRNTIDGLNITTKLELTPWEAWFGTKKTVDTLHGKLKVNIPKKAQTGQRVRLPNKGFRDMKENLGDLYLEFVINNPDTLTKEQEEVYRTLNKEG